MKELNFGIIGFGYFGKYHAKVLQRIPGVNLKAVASNSFPAAADETLSPAVTRFEKAEDLLRDPAIDCVIIATPPSTHLSLLKLAASFNKHIFVEKPIVTKSEELKELEEVFKDYSSCLMVGYIYFYNDYLRCIKKTIEEGEIGKVRLARFRQLGRGPIRKDTTPFEDIGTHYLSIMEYLFGVSELKTATGMATGISPVRDDFMSANLLYANGIAANIETGWFAPKKEKQMMIVGDKGWIVFDDVQKKLTLSKLSYPSSDTVSATASIWLDAAPEEEVDLTERAAAKDPQQNELEHFVECVRSGQKPSTDIEHALRMVEAANLVSKSILRA